MEGLWVASANCLQSDSKRRHSNSRFRRLIDLDTGCLPNSSTPNLAWRYVNVGGPHHGGTGKKRPCLGKAITRLESMQPLQAIDGQHGSCTAHARRCRDGNQEANAKIPGDGPGQDPGRYPDWVSCPLFVLDGPTQANRDSSVAVSERSLVVPAAIGD